MPSSGGPGAVIRFGRRASVLVAVTSEQGDRVCAANGFNYRLDTPSARAFLGQFVTLP